LLSSFTDEYAAVFEVPQFEVHHAAAGDDASGSRGGAAASSGSPASSESSSRLLLSGFMDDYESVFDISPPSHALSGETWEALAEIGRPGQLNSNLNLILNLLTVIGDM
jgi:hypothetical protein